MTATNVRSLELRASAAPPAVGSAQGWLVRAGLFVVFSSLVVDAFPPGTALLREFGARPVNFLLAAIAAGQLLMSVRHWKIIALGRWQAPIAMVGMFAVSLLNLYIALERSGPDGAAVLSSWIRQYLMFAWGIASYFIWKRLLRPVEPEMYCRLLAIASVIPLLAFLLEYASPAGPVRDLLDLFRNKADFRPSGFSNEPSTYTAWVAFAWPIVLFAGLRARTGSRRAVTLLLFLFPLGLSALLSHARTGVVIFVLQVLYFAYTRVRAQRAFGGVVRSVILVAFVLAASTAIVWSRLTTLTAVNGSNAARLAYTAAGIGVSLDHPWLGIGIGQFSYFFGSYVPSFALNIQEVAMYAYGLGNYRASPFNLFVRLFCEFGIPLGLLFAARIVRPIVTAARSSASVPFLPYAALSAVGGVGYWLSQDQYGYQPAILSLAVLALVLEGAAAVRGRGRKRRGLARQEAVA